MSDEIAGAEPGQGADTGDDLPQRFSLVAGGAFHDFLGFLGLLARDGLPSRRAALALGSVAFLIPAAAVVLQSLFDEQYSGWDYFGYATVYARFLVSIIVMVSADPSSASDLNASVEIVYAMRSFPVDRAALVQLLVSAGIPMLVMAALQMPLGDLMKLIFLFLL